MHSVSLYDGGPIKSPIKPLSTIVLWWSEGFQVALNRVPMMPRDASLSDSYTPDRCCFSSLIENICMDSKQFSFAESKEKKHNGPMHLWYMGLTKATFYLGIIQSTVLTATWLFSSFFFFIGRKLCVEAHVCRHNEAFSWTPRYNERNPKLGQHDAERQ